MTNPAAPRTLTKPKPERRQHQSCASVEGDLQSCGDSATFKKHRSNPSMRGWLRLGLVDHRAVILGDTPLSRGNAPEAPSIWELPGVRGAQAHMTFLIEPTDIGTGVDLDLADALETVAATIRAGRDRRFLSNWVAADPLTLHLQRTTQGAWELSE